MALNDKLLQLKDNINSLKQELTNAVASKGGNVSESNSFSEIINSINNIDGGGEKLKWVDLCINTNSQLTESVFETLKSKFDFSGLRCVDGMFYYNMNFTKIEMFDTPDVTELYNSFNSCENLREISFLNTSNIGRMYGVFQFCYNLAKINMIDVSKVYEMTYTFGGCTSLKYMLLKNLGTQQNITQFMYGIHDAPWGAEDELIPESIGARQSLVDSLITYSFDRTSAGYSTLTYNLSETTKSILTEEEIAAVTAKGYTIA